MKDFDRLKRRLTLQRNESIYRDQKSANLLQRLESGSQLAQTRTQQKQSRVKTLS
jgi:hypothetical protein